MKLDTADSEKEKYPEKEKFHKTIKRSIVQVLMEVGDQSAPKHRALETNEAIQRGINIEPSSTISPPVSQWQLSRALNWTKTEGQKVKQGFPKRNTKSMLHKGLQQNIKLNF